MNDPNGGNPQGLTPGLCRAATGLDVGFLGALGVIAWFVAGSSLGGGLWFSRLNLAAAPFFGDLVFYSGPGRHTAVGAAVLLLVYSLLGLLYGLLPAARHGWLNILTALGFAGLVHLCAGAWLWKAFHPFAPPYFAPLAVAPAHLFFGLALWRYPARARSIAISIGDSAARAELAPPPPAPLVQELAQPAVEQGEQASGGSPETADPTPEVPDSAITPPGSESNPGDGHGGPARSSLE